MAKKGVLRNTSEPTLTCLTKSKIAAGVCRLSEAKLLSTASLHGQMLKPCLTLAYAMHCFLCATFQHITTAPVHCRYAVPTRQKLLDPVTTSRPGRRKFLDEEVYCPGKHSEAQGVPELPQCPVGPSLYLGITALGKGDLCDAHQGT